MARTKFANKWSVAANDVLAAATHFNDPGDGLEAEFVLVRGDIPLDGVVSGMACTINSAQIDIASGRAYVGGKRYNGSASVDFTGAAADTYYVYIDSADDTTPYNKKTTVPTSGELTLCTVVCDGADNLSSLDDNIKVTGILPYDIHIQFDGLLSTSDVRVIPVPHDLWIDEVQIICKDNGSSSSVIADVHLGADGSSGTTIFSTQANRPSLDNAVANYTKASSGKPDGDRKPDSGEHLEVWVDDIGGDGRDMGVTIKARLR